jgi:hypothetical protein
MNLDGYVRWAVSQLHPSVVAGLSTSFEPIAPHRIGIVDLAQIDGAAVQTQLTHDEANLLESGLMLGGSELVPLLLGWSADVDPRTVGLVAGREEYRDAEHGRTPLG